jgi:hypothetical protein
MGASYRKTVDSFNKELLYTLAGINYPVLTPVRRKSLELSLVKYIPSVFQELNLD